MDTNEIFKYRSVTACMRASYELVTSHLFQILKKTWWASLILAIFTVCTIGDNSILGHLSPRKPSFISSPSYAPSLLAVLYGIGSTLKE